MMSAMLSMSGKAILSRSKDFPSLAGFMPVDDFDKLSGGSDDGVADVFGGADVFAIFNVLAVSGILDDELVFQKVEMALNQEICCD